MAVIERKVGRFLRWLRSEYRPERHYMRGGKTRGSKSLRLGITS